MITETTAGSGEKSWQGSSEATTHSPRSVSVSKESKRKESWWRTTQRYIWDDPDKPAEEKKFLRKLDFYLLTYTCLGYFCKNLDQSNISNAYVSGMQEAIGMSGNDLTYAGNVFTAGYVISQIPAVILVTKLRPSHMIPLLETLWAIVTFSSAAVTTTRQLHAMRFLIGVCEGAFFPTIIYLISSWYTARERAKRVTLFYSTACLAPMFSGYLQAAAYNNLDGVAGRAGWQWLFIVCGIVSLPVGVLGFFFNPDFPENTRAFYLSADEAAFARRRLAADGYTPLGAATAWDRAKILRIFGTWQFWVLGTSYFFVQSACPTQQPFFALYLKATNHSVYERNVWPTGQYAVGFVTQVLAGMLSDSPLLKGRRWQAISVMQGGTIFSAIVLAVWNVPDGLKYFAYFLSYTSAGVPGLYYSWFPDLMPGDHEMRGFMTAFSNIFSYVNQIWYADAVWRTSESPQFKPGFIACATFGVILILTTIFMRFLEVRDKKRAPEHPHTVVDGTAANAPAVLAAHDGDVV